MGLKSEEMRPNLARSERCLDLISGKRGGETIDELKSTNAGRAKSYRVGKWNREPRFILAQARRCGFFFAFSWFFLPF
jgi:hypothetical protein